MAFQRILVTGAAGMLGRDLCDYLKAKGYTVLAGTRSTLDLLKTQDELDRTLEELQPEIIVHAAALTNVDQAEREPELAMAVNKDGTRKLALAAAKVGATLAYVSTDYVFDGAKGSLYTVDDRPNPINTYGLSKYYGELQVSELLDTYYIMRTSWVYGIHGRNFVDFVIQAAREGREIPVVTDWVGSPTWTGNLCATIEKVFLSGRFGIYHTADEGAVSRFDQAQAICRAAGLSPDHIRPVSGRELSLPARRPDDTALDCSPLAVPSWKTSLQGYLAQYNSGYPVMG
ncbi:MAG: dTDP-4-dehydrorhamnose reductase [Candidatus Melainabacteria bacterium]